MGAGPALLLDHIERSDERIASGAIRGGSHPGAGRERVDVETLEEARGVCDLVECLNAGYDRGPAVARRPHMRAVRAVVLAKHARVYAVQLVVGRDEHMARSGGRDGTCIDAHHPQADVGDPHGLACRHIHLANEPLPHATNARVRHGTGGGAAQNGEGQWPLRAGNGKGAAARRRQPGKLLGLRRRLLGWPRKRLRGVGLEVWCT